MKVVDYRNSVRLVSIVDTRTWWEKSILSRVSPRMVLGMTIYGGLVGAMLGALQ